MSLPHILPSIPALQIQFPPDERQEMLASIEDILCKGILSQGPYVQALEARTSAYTGVRFALAVNSGSGAIEVAMRALEVAGKEVLLPTNTFLATAAGVLLAGGNIRLVDSDPTTFSVSLAALKQRATPHTAGVIIVHIGGIISPEIDAIRHWCDQQGYWLFEDAAHALGSTLNGRAAGTFGRAGSYSFFATKVLGCGEGGIIVTDDEEFAQRCALYRNHGKPEPWVSYHVLLSSNYRLSEIMAAVTNVQLAHLDAKIARRAQIAHQYTNLLRSILPELQLVLPAGSSNWYKYIVLLPAPLERAALKQQMKEQGVALPGEVYEIPLHRQPALAHIVEPDSSFPAAEALCQQHICLPIYPDLTDEQVQRVVATLRQVITALQAA